LTNLDCDAVFAPYRHEVILKTRWLPAIESQVGCDAILYPYWPSPPRRRPEAPPAAVYVHDLAFRLRPAEVPWQQRAYLGTVLAPALKRASAVLVPSETTRRDLLASYPLPGLEGRVSVVPEGLSSPAAPGKLPEGFGLPLIEAMARGVPAVIGSSGALPELAAGTAIEVDAQDVDSIARGLETLLSDPALRTRLGAEGMRRAADFTWERSAVATLA